MSQIPPPLLKHGWALDHIRWGYQDAEAALGRQSAFPSLIAAIEGRSSQWRPMDLADDPQGALSQIDKAARLGAARKYRIWKVGVSNIALTHRYTLELVYSITQLAGLESFNTLGNLSVLSLFGKQEAERAQRKHLDWLRALSKKVYPGKDARGRPKTPAANDEEKKIHDRIHRESQATLKVAVEAWIAATQGERLDEAARRAAG